MIGFEPRISAIGSDRSANCVTAIVPDSVVYLLLPTEEAQYCHLSIV